MKRNEKLLRLLWFSGFGGIYIAALIFMVRSATLMRGPSALIILLSFGAALLGGLVFYSVKTFLASLGVGAALLLVRFLALWDGRDWTAQLRSLGSRLSDIWSQIMGAPYRQEDGSLLILLLAALFALLAVCSFYKKVRFWLAALPPLICYLLGAMGRYEVNVPACLTVFFCLVTLFLGSRRPAEAGHGTAALEMNAGKGRARFWFTSGLPVCALLTAAVSMALAALLPLTSNPSQSMRSYVPQYADLGEFLQSFHIEGHWFSITGFSDGDTPLGGDLYLDDSQVMDVRAGGRVYLTGAAYKSYNGRTWLAGDDGTLLCDPTDLEAGREEELFREGVYKSDRVTVTMRQAGDNLFYPERAQSVRLSGGSTLFTDQEGGYYVQPALTPGDSYSADARILDVSSADAAAALAAAGSGYYAGRNNGDMAAYAEGIRRDYTVLPESLPARVASLAHELTDGKNGDYEKAKAVEQYLCGSYTYTLRPGTLPEGQDFADYFLFESRQGYCTHYATAMTVLCRAVGLPARFVKGFVTPAQPGASGAYEVTGRTSHAWVEVYLEGLGWVRFEPTSPFNEDWNNRVQVLDQAVAENQDYLAEIGFVEDEDGQELSSRPENVLSRPSVTSAPASSAPSSLPASSSSYLSDYAGSAPDGETPSDIPSVLPSAPPDGFLPEDQARPEGDRSSLWLGVLLLVLAAVLLGAALVQIGRVKRRVRLRREASGKRRMQLTFREILRLLEYLGAKARTGETAAAMAQRLEEDERFAGLGLSDAAGLYEAVLFGPLEPEEADCRRMDEVYEGLFAQVRQKLSGPAYLWQRYVRNRI